MGTRLFVLLLPLLMLLQACDGTPFGQRLSESFDSQAGEVSPAGTQDDPDDSVSDTRVVAGKDEQQIKAKVKAKDKEKPKAKVDEDEDSTESERVPEREQPAARADSSDSTELRSTPERTLPYRIMIRLSAADPAAPAEAVTEALRRAGIGFEVETIEKAPVSDRNQPSNLRQKPAS